MIIFINLRQNVGNGLAIPMLGTVQPLGLIMRNGGEMRDGQGREMER